MVGRQVGAENQERAQCWPTLLVFNPSSAVLQALNV
jgi:hypothetical protein